MFFHLRHTRYGQRWQVETVFSMIKRRLGDTLRAHTFWSQHRAAAPKLLAHNILILRHIEVLDRASCPVCAPPFYVHRPTIDSQIPYRYDY